MINRQSQIRTTPSFFSAMEPGWLRVCAEPSIPLNHSVINFFLIDETPSVTGMDSDTCPTVLDVFVTSPSNLGSFLSVNHA